MSVEPVAIPDKPEDNSENETSSFTDEEWEEWKGATVEASITLDANPDERPSQEPDAPDTENLTELFVPLHLESPKQTSRALNSLTESLLYRKLKSLLKEGAIQAAKSLLREQTASELGDPRIRKYQQVLEPADVRFTEKEDRNEVHNNNEWLSNEQNREKHRGEWIALHDGNLIAHADGYESLIEEVDETSDLLITQIF
jgi:hypothetical protein